VGKIIIIQQNSTKPTFMTFTKAATVDENENESIDEKVGST